MSTTPATQAISARNATTHGLFARDIVLPHLGEDPNGYKELLLDLSQQLLPKNLIERHYVEKIAAASWRLRRLQRWQAQLYEDTQLTEDARIAKLDKVLRQETTLHRKIDTSIRMIGRDVPHLFESRARKQALAELGETESQCKQDSALDRDITQIAQQNLLFVPLPADFDRTRLDNSYAEKTEICENETAPDPVGAALRGCPSGLHGCPSEERGCPADESHKLFPSLTPPPRYRGPGSLLLPRYRGPGEPPNPPVSGEPCEARRWVPGGGFIGSEQRGTDRRGVCAAWPLEENRKLEGLMLRVPSVTAAWLELLRNAGHYDDLRLLMENYGKISHFAAHVRTSVSQIVYPEDDAEDDE